MKIIVVCNHLGQNIINTQIYPIYVLQGAPYLILLNTQDTIVYYTNNKVFHINSK